MRIVEFNDGKFGVRVGSWFKGYSFLGSDLYEWIYDLYFLDNVNKYCKFETYEEAKTVFDLFEKKTNLLGYKIIK